MEKPTVYSWWGNQNEPPPNLKTKKQLAEIGMKPVKPVGVIELRKYDLYLYDPNNPDSAIPKKKASEAQLKALAKGREKQQRKAQYKEWYKDIGRFIKDKNKAIEWARKVLENRDEWVILDTETTGSYDAEIVQICIINLEGKTILDSLVKPTILIPEEVISIHGITNEAVTNAPSFTDIYPLIIESLRDKKLLIYNINFDISILEYCCNLHNLPILELSEESECVMRWYAQYYGEWSYYYKSYKWQPLNGEHNAIGDCLATLALIKEMASSEIQDVEEEFRKTLNT